MRRHERTSEGSLPPRLAVFVAEDWVGRDKADKYSEWMDARSAYGDKRGWLTVPGDEEAWAAFPDGDWFPEDL